MLGRRDTDNTANHEGTPKPHVKPFDAVGGFPVTIMPPVSAGIEVGIFANVAELIVNITFTPEVECVDGMQDRLYWLDHQEKEDPRPANVVYLSRTNTFEMDIIAALVSHLEGQGRYGSEDITVINPNLGQLQKIKQ